MKNLLNYINNKENDIHSRILACSRLCEALEGECKKADRNSYWIVNRRKELVELSKELVKQKEQIQSELDAVKEEWDNLDI